MIGGMLGRSFAFVWITKPTKDFTVVWSLFCFSVLLVGLGVGV